MNSGVKAVLYVVLLIATAISGYFFFKSFGKLFEDEKATTQAAAAASAAQEAGNSETNAPPDTNAVASANLAATNATTSTNLEAAATNETPDTNATVATTTTTVGKSRKPTAANPPKSRIGFWTGSFILSVIGLGGLIAWDFSNYLGSKTLKVIYNDDGAGQKDKDYDEAEQMWANGQPLESIRMMREYLNKNPREVHVALRIAEIYEKDLNNFLAAALEYEEVLKKKLPDERWGWAAIHLCNLYFKLGQEVKGFALLQRIVKEYGETQAAEKARKRLKEVDPGLLAEADPAAATEDDAEPESEAPKSNLPPGFRPKK